MIGKFGFGGPLFHPQGIPGQGDAAEVTPAERLLQADRNAQGPRGQQRADSVELSAEARALAGSEVQGLAHTEEGSGLSADRLQSVVERIESGFYDSDGARHSIASRILNELNAG